jgi:hypothetical protein
MLLQLADDALQTTTRDDWSRMRHLVAQHLSGHALLRWLHSCGAAGGTRWTLMRMRRQPTSRRCRL